MSEAETGSAPPSATKSGARIFGLDALRGLAVFLMIEQHLGVWLWEGPARGKTIMAYPALLTFNALGGAAAPLFMVLAGLGSALFAEKALAKGREPDRVQFRRGLVVFGFGVLLNLLTPTWFSWCSWFVLHLMGVGMMLTPWLRRLPTSALLLAGALVLGATAPLQLALDTPARMVNDYMAARMDPVPAWAPLRIMIAEGQFPIFPWMSMYLAGMCAGRWVANEERNKILLLGLGALALGGALVGMRVLAHPEAGTLLWRIGRIPVPFFPASPALVLLLMGAVFLAVRGVLAWDERRPFRETSLPVTFGRASLTLLLLHVVLVREGAHASGHWQSLGASTALSVLLGFVVVAALASRFWQRVDYRFGAEWALRKLAG